MTLDEIKSKTDFNFDTIQEDVNDDYLLSKFLTNLFVVKDEEQLKIAFGFFECSYFINKRTYDTKKSLALATSEYLEKRLGI